MHALPYTLGVFALILLLTRLKVPLAAAVSGGVIVLGLVFLRSVTGVAEAAVQGIIQPQAVALVIITVLILGLSGLMQKGGQFKEIVSLARAMLRRPAVTMAALPALVGLLPMPGGALFSAPMVESAAGDHQVDGGRLSAVNYWFRHVWEHWWPLYPGVMLALTVSHKYTGGGYVDFAVFQIPLGISMAAAGLIMFRGTGRQLRAKGEKPPPGTKRRLLWATSPIWVIIAVWIPAKQALFAPLSSLVPEEFQSLLQNYAPLILGLLVSVVWTAFLKRHRLGAVARVFATRSVASVALLVLSVMVFQYMLLHVGAAAQIAGDLQTYHVPLELMVAGLPFIAGLVTGLAVGFVGTSFPIVLFLVAAVPDVGSIRPYLALAYAFGHLGQMLSPLHLCQVVSNRYFQTTYAPVYRYLFPACIANAVLAVVYFILLRLAF